MSERGARLHARANRQIRALSELVATREHVLTLACPGREKLGDGTVGATAEHVAHVYQLLARFIRGCEPQERRPGPGRAHDAAGAGHAPGPGTRAVLERLSSATRALGGLAALTDEQLDSVPPAGSFRFADGRRTLEEVIAGVINHQSHHIDAAITVADSNRGRP